MRVEGHKKKSADHSKCQIINRCLSLKSGVNLSLLSARRFKSELLLDYVAKWQSISDMQWIYSNRRVVLMIHLSRSPTKSPFGFKSRKKNLFYFFKYIFFLSSRGFHCKQLIKCMYHLSYCQCH